MHAYKHACMSACKSICVGVDICVVLYKVLCVCVFVYEWEGLHIVCRYICMCVLK